MKKNILIFGASGFLGWSICSLAREQWNVIAVGNAKTPAIPGVDPAQCDITDTSALQHLFTHAKPDAVIHAAAASQPNWCQEHPAESRRVNVDASLEIASLCANHHIPCVFTSSDLVFDGTAAPYRETDPVNPICIYGEQKATAEAGMRERHPGCVICRMPLMFGIAGPGANSFLQPWITSLKEGRPLNLFVDEFRTPVSGRTAAKGLLLAVEKGEEILHLGGRERFSRYDMGIMLCRLLGIDTALVKPGYQKDVNMAAPRAADVCMDSSKAFSMGYAPATIEIELRRVLVDMSIQLKG